MLKVSGGNYYEALPPSQFGVGDIWSMLPSFGHLDRSSIIGVIVTPACDLANRKVETLTYLPIISVSEYLTGRSFSVEVLRVLKGQAKAAELNVSIFDGLKGISLPSIQGLESLSKAASTELAACKEAKRKIMYQKILAATDHLVSVRTRNLNRSVQSVRSILGNKEFDRAINEIVKNSYSNDTHFFPSDGRVKEMSVMNEHSVALFRYAMSIPVELLELAQEPACHDWSAAITGVVGEFPIVTHSEARPIRVGRLKPAFVPDLISRFTSLYVRMGSPDFSLETVSEYSAQIGAYK
ncbi:hypothetical protein [Xanthomonas arboricola]|uniref:hypothetical protein n=1 Tax=Xanthomonas arboricola TaxID=56448 RepID=UPI0012D2DA92|nr:hypothetical protein [Xanthomonas arboricola]